MSYTNDNLNKIIFVPAIDPNSVGVGLTALDSVTTGTNNTAVGTNAGTAITTGSNNLVLATPNGVDGITTASNSLWIGGGSTAVMSATGINSTPTVTIPGNLIVTGTFTGGTTNDVGATIGGISSGFTNTGSTLATITGLSFSVVPGTYILNGYLVVQCAATPGIKVSLSTSTATASSVLIDTWLYSTSTLTGESNFSTAALTGNLISAAVTATAADITGTLIITTAGTITLQAAQSVSNATVLTVTNGSYLEATRVA